MENKKKPSELIEELDCSAEGREWSRMTIQVIKVITVIR